MDRPVFVFSPHKRFRRRRILVLIILLLVIGAIVAVTVKLASAPSATEVTPTPVSVTPVSATPVPTVTVLPTPTATPMSTPMPTAEMTVTATPLMDSTPAKTVQPTKPNQAVSGKGKYISELMAVTGLEEIETIKGYVNIRDLGLGIRDDIRYAGKNNVLGKPIYTADVCVAPPEMAYRLALAQQKLRKQGYSLLIWDVYRPTSAQEKLKSASSNNQHVAQDISKHSRGTAVDVTLVNLKTGKQLTMPSDFDDFENGSRSQKMTAEVKRNLKILTDAMEGSGFNTYAHEWWHFTLETTPPATDYDMQKVFGKWAE